MRRAVMWKRFAEATSANDGAAPKYSQAAIAAANVATSSMATTRKCAFSIPVIPKCAKSEARGEG